MNIQQDNSKQNARTRHIDIRLTQKEYEAIASLEWSGATLIYSVITEYLIR